MTGRVYDERPESVWDVEYDTWRSESRWDAEPNVVTAGTGRGDAVMSVWDQVAPVTSIEPDDFAREMWGAAS